MTKVCNQFYNSDYLRYYAFLALICFIILNSVLYLFFVNFGVSEIFFKKQVAAELKNLKEENQIIQGEYLEEFKKITLDYGYNNGFTEAKTPIFVSRSSAVALNPHTSGAWR